MSECGKRIRTIRVMAGMTQQEFADAIGIKQNTLSGVESGRRMPGRDVLLSICRRFDLSTDCVLGREPLPDDIALRQTIQNAPPLEQIIKKKEPRSEHIMLAISKTLKARLVSVSESYETNVNDLINQILDSVLPK